MVASMGPLARLSMATVGTGVGSYSEAHEFESESLKKVSEIKDTNGITGSRSHHSERTRFGLDQVSGMIKYAWSPLIGDILLPRIGFSASGTTFSLTEALTPFDVLVERIVQRHIYGSCYVNSAEWEFTPGEIVKCTLDLRGKSESVSATAFPSIATPLDVPFTAADGGVTFVGTSRSVMSLRVKIDNALNVRFTIGSNQATDISPTDRIVMVTATLPYTSSESDLYGQALLGSAATIVATNGGTSTTFTFGKVQFPDQSPVVASRNGEIVLEMTGIARMTSTTKELVITHDSTP